jgi:hypothetical protein
VPDDAYESGGIAPCKFMPCFQNAGQNRNINIGNKPFENAAKFKHYGETLTNKSFIQKKLRAN